MKVGRIIFNNGKLLFASQNVEKKIKDNSSTLSVRSGTSMITDYKSIATSKAFSCLRSPEVSNSERTGSTLASKKEKSIRSLSNSRKSVQHKKLEPRDMLPSLPLVKIDL